MSIVLNRKRERLDNDVNEPQETHRNVKMHIKKHIDMNRKRPHNVVDGFASSPWDVDNNIQQYQKRNKMVDNNKDNHEYEYGTIHSTYAYDPIKMVFL